MGEHAMQQLWAPWRLTYVAGPKDTGCFLCRILRERNDRANLVLLRGETCAIVINRYPYNNGHLMICPNRHTAALDALTPAERLEMMDLAARSVAALRDTLRAEGCNIGINLGRVAGAGLEEHVHMHVVPRWNGDTNFMPVTADVKVVPQSLDALWDSLALVMRAHGRKA
jgi:ATP adenylyltransferase